MEIDAVSGHHLLSGFFFGLGNVFSIKIYDEPKGLPIARLMVGFMIHGFEKRKQKGNTSIQDIFNKGAVSPITTFTDDDNRIRL